MFMLGGGGGYWQRVCLYIRNSIQHLLQFSDIYALRWIVTHLSLLHQRPTYCLEGGRLLSGGGSVLSGICFLPPLLCSYSSLSFPLFKSTVPCPFLGSLVIGGLCPCKNYKVFALFGLGNWVTVLSFSPCHRKYFYSALLFILVLCISMYNVSIVISIHCLCFNLHVLMICMSRN